MLFGLANDLIWPAILMVVAISAGMAVAMAGIGVFALWGRGWAERRLATDPRRQQRFANGTRLAGASFVFGLGLLLFGATFLHGAPELRALDKVVVGSSHVSAFEG